MFIEIEQRLISPTSSPYLRTKELNQGDELITKAISKLEADLLANRQNSASPYERIRINTHRQENQQSRMNANHITQYRHTSTVVNGKHNGNQIQKEFDKNESAKNKSEDTTSNYYRKVTSTKSNVPMIQRKHIAKIPTAMATRTPAKQCVVTNSNTSTNMPITKTKAKARDVIDSTNTNKTLSSKLPLSKTLTTTADAKLTNVKPPIAKQSINKTILSSSIATQILTRTMPRTKATDVKSKSITSVPKSSPRQSPGKPITSETKSNAVTGKKPVSTIRKATKPENSQVNASKTVPKLPKKADVKTASNLLKKVDIKMVPNLLKKVDTKTVPNLLKKVDTKTVPNLLKKVDTKTVPNLLKKVDTKTVPNLLKKVDTKTVPKSPKKVDVSTKSITAGIPRKTGSSTVSKLPIGSRYNNAKLSGKLSNTTNIGKPKSSSAGVREEKATASHVPLKSIPPQRKKEEIYNTANKAEISPKENNVELESKIASLDDNQSNEISEVENNQMNKQEPDVDVKKNVGLLKEKGDLLRSKDIMDKHYKELQEGNLNVYSAEKDNTEETVADINSVVGENDCDVMLKSEDSSSTQECNEAKVSTQECSEAKVSTQECSEAKVSTQECSEAKVSTQECSEAKVSTQECSEAKVSTQECSEAKVSTQECSEAKVSTQECSEAKVLHKSAVKQRSLHKSAVKQRSLHKSAVKQRFLHKSAVKQRSLHKSAVKQRFLHKSAVKQRFLHKSAVK